MYVQYNGLAMASEVNGHNESRQRKNVTKLYTVL